MTNTDLINHVMSRIAKAGGEEATLITRPVIQASIPLALAALARKHPMNESFTVSCVNGLINTSSLPILHSVLPFGCSLTFGNQPAHPMPSLEHLNMLTGTTMFPYFTVEGRNLRVRNTDGSLTSLNATGTLVVPKIWQTADEVPPELAEELVDTLFEIVVKGAK